MPLYPFPNIPSLPGVPAIPRLTNDTRTVITASLGAIQGILWSIVNSDNRWGIFDEEGEPIYSVSGLNAMTNAALQALGFQAVMAFDGMDYTKEMKVANYPVEQGGFAAYNKVETPGQSNVTMVLAGPESERESFLSAIDDACKSTGLYSISTPETTYINYTIERYGYEHRQTKNANILVIEMTLSEIRQVSAQYTTVERKIDAPKNPTAAPPVNTGKVQPATPNTSVLKQLQKQLPELSSTVQQYLDGILK